MPRSNRRNRKTRRQRGGILGFVANFFKPKSPLSSANTRGVSAGQNATFSYTANNALGGTGTGGRRSRRNRRNRRRTCRRNRR